MALEAYACPRNPYHNKRNHGKYLKYRIKQELRAHMALVTRREELRAKRSYGMSSNKIL